MLFNKPSVLVLKYQVLPIRSHKHNDETVHWANPLQICPFRRLNRTVKNNNHAHGNRSLGFTNG
jgi:hypothetical protein